MNIDKKKLIGILSIGRTDHSYFRPILNEIKKDSTLKYFLIVAGMHLSPEFGLTYKEIIKDGFHIDEKIEVTLSSNTSEGAAKTTGLMAIGISSILSKHKFNALLVLGDRYETLGAVVAAIPYNIPIAHIFGGEITEGVFDEQIRHAITKMAHIHFASNQLSAKRIIQMGEERWRVFNVGSPCIDMIKQAELYSRRSFFKIYGLNFSKKLFLVTFHPVTLELEDTEYHVRNLIDALKYFDANIIVTYPNSDPGAATIIENFRNASERNRNIGFIKNLRIKGYYSAMKYADVMIGNSSSGIIESATFKLPVVNIGNRQKNRLRGNNVIDSDYNAQDIIKKINAALLKTFRNSLKNLKNPYGNGNSSKKIVNILKQFLTKKSQSELITKKFISI